MVSDHVLGRGGGGGQTVGWGRSGDCELSVARTVVSRWNRMFYPKRLTRLFES